MSQPEFTPGPWEFVRTLGDPAVAMPHQKIGFYPERIASFNRDVKEGNAFANARLAAESPAMYDIILSVIALPCLGTDENNDVCGETYTCQNCKLSKKAGQVAKRIHGESA